MYWVVATLLAALAGYLYTQTKPTALLLLLAALGASYISAVTYHRSELSKTRERLKELHVELLERKEEIHKLREMIAHAEEEKRQMREELISLRSALARDKEAETGYLLEKAIEMEKQTESD
jgi:septal ring factor EnvC (AmiA/AmiB activator)